MLRSLSLSIIIASGLLSCKKVIELDLKDGAQQVVIEGEITNMPPPYSVKLSRTGSLSNLTGIESIDDAQVFISDLSGLTDTLTRTMNGIYMTNKIVGTPGQTYALTVRLHDTVYMAQSTMPMRVPLDSILIEKSNGFGGSEFKQITPKYTDPIGVANYYQFRLYSTDSLTLSNVLFEDALNDGKENTRPFFAKLPKGKIAKVEMRCYNRDAYTYQFGLSQIEQNGRNQSASPANPTNNIKGFKALGYFSANTYEVQVKPVDF